MKVMKVFLKTILDKNQQRKEFTLTHANSILAHQKRNPPFTWQLDDENFELKDGVIIEKSKTIE